MSPIKMLKAAYGAAIDVLLDAFGIEEIDRDHLTLKPHILNDDRASRGEEALQFQSLPALPKAGGDNRIA
jgi:hypothetical protein